MPLIQIILINIGHALVHLLMLLFPVVAALAATSFEENYGTLIMLTTGSWVAFGLGSLPAGWLADRWGRNLLMSVFFVGSGLSCLLVALSQSYTQLTMSLLCLGIFSAIYHPVGIAILAGGGQKTMGRRLAFNGVWGNLGVAFSTIVAVSLAQLLGWQSAFYIPGVFSIIIGLIWIIWVPQKNNIQITDRRQFDIFFDKGTAWLALFKLVALFSIIIGFIFNAVIVSLPKLLDERLNTIGESANSVSFFAFTIYIIAACAQLTVGHLIDRFQVKPIFISISVSLIISLIFVIFTTNFFLIISASIMMALVYSTLPISDTLLARNIPSHVRSRVFALIYFISFTASALAIPAIAILHLRGGFTELYIIMIILTAVLALIISKLPKQEN